MRGGIVSAHICALYRCVPSTGGRLLLLQLLEELVQAVEALVHPVFHAGRRHRVAIQFPRYGTPRLSIPMHNAIMAYLQSRRR